MRIVELGDYSIVIMKDSEDPPWLSLGQICRNAGTVGAIAVIKDIPVKDVFQVSNDFMYSGGRIVLFFDGQVNPQFKLHDRILLKYLQTRRCRR